MICSEMTARGTRQCLALGAGASGQRGVKRGTGRKWEGAVGSSGAHVQGEKPREGQGWPRMGTDRAVDASTDKGRAANEASSTATSLYIYCRNLDLYSKSLKPSGSHESAARTYTHWSSPAQCGCSEIHLEEKDARTQGQRAIVRAQRKRTFPNHAQPSLRTVGGGVEGGRGHHPHLPDTVSRGRHLVKPVEPGSMSLPLILK